MKEIAQRSTAYINRKEQLQRFKEQERALTGSR